jgi:arsenate reductase (glutaredoxin)
MEAQVFGMKSCNETKKALRFFKERRIRVHFVDLKERAASPGELRRFAERFGTEALIDRDGKRYRDRGLHVAHVSEPRVIPMLAEDPHLLRTPLVRMGKDLGIGWDEARWRARVTEA